MSRKKLPEIIETNQYLAPRWVDQVLRDNLDIYLERAKILSRITNPTLRLEQEKIWAIKDAAEEIADAIRSTNRRPRGLFGF